MRCLEKVIVIFFGVFVLFISSCTDKIGVNTKLSIPENLAAVNVTATTVKLVWDSVPNTYVYKLFYGTTSDITSMNYRFIYSDDSTECTFNSLNIDTPYYFCIMAKKNSIYDNNEDDSEISSIIEIKTNELLSLQAPTNFCFTDTFSNGNVRLSWNPVQDASCYKLYCSPHYTTAIDLMENDTPYTYYGESASINLLFDSTTYYFVLCAVNGSIISEASEVISTTTGILPLPTPENLQITKYTSTSVSISWDVVTGATEYEVYFGTSTNNLSLASTVTTTSYTKRGLTPETTYYFAIKAYSTIKESELTDSVSQKTDIAGASDDDIPESIVGMVFSVNGTDKYLFTDFSSCELQNFTMTSGYEWYNRPTYTYTMTSDTEATLVVDYTYYSHRVFSYAYYYYCYSYNTMTYYLTFNSSTEGTYSQKYYNKFKTVDQDDTDTDIFSRTLTGIFTLE